MATANSSRVCFLVSPLPYGGLPGQENEQARNLAEDFLIPSIEAEGFTIISESEGLRQFAGQQRNPGTAIGSAMEWLERSDLVVIDMTQDAENCIFYSGYRNALKKPCLVYTAGKYATSGDIGGVKYVRRPSRDVSKDMKIQHLRESIRETINISHAELQHTAIAPASDRYVSVNDNRLSFEELVARLSAIRDEYARDHNRLATEPAALDLMAEVEAISAQINHGRVRLRQITDGLVPSFENACLLLAAYPGLVQLIHDAAATAKEILTFFGYT